MRRVLSVVTASVLLVLAIATGSGPANDNAAQAAGTAPPCIGNGCLTETTTVVGGGGDDGTPMASKHHEPYCADATAAATASVDTANASSTTTTVPLKWTFVSIPMPVFRTSNDTTITTSQTVVMWTGPSDLYVISEPIVVPDIAVAQKYTFTCIAFRGVALFESKRADFWVPLVTPDSVAFNDGLLAKVQGRLTMPNVTWLDIDKDHDWLWVNYDHHLEVTPPAEVYESATDSSPITGQSATAWVKATPISLTLELPSNTGIRATQLANCDLTKATSDKGCKIKFTHASSIDDDGLFEGTATITWAVTSNSGKYNGVGPFKTTTGFRVQVAESMAVSKPGN